MKVQILKDVYSYSKKECLYAKEGEIVTVIKITGNIVIVENSNGNRFHVTETNLKMI